MKWKTQVQVVRGPAGAFLAVPAKTEVMNQIKPDTDYTVEIKRYRERRSLTANAYCWVLCQRIAEELSKHGQYISKEEVYRKAVRDCQMFDYVMVKGYAAESFQRRWNASGVGWQAVELTKKDDNVVFMVFQGSSVYNTEEMGRLIECLIDEANQLGIETRPVYEVMALMREADDEES